MGFMFCLDLASVKDFFTIHNQCLGYVSEKASKHSGLVPELHSFR